MLSLFIKYSCIAALLALTIVLANVMISTGEIRSFTQAIRFWFWVTMGPGIGMFIGALIRKWLLPDAIYTNEGMTGIFKAKLFWAIGPQGIGWLLGLLSIAGNLY
jgi:hypothetical protein